MGGPVSPTRGIPVQLLLQGLYPSLSARAERVLSRNLCPAGDFECLTEKLLIIGALWHGGLSLPSIET